MTTNRFAALLLGGMLAAGFNVAGAFTPDEFNGTSLGSQWTFVPSPAPLPTTNQSFDGSHYVLEAPLGSDLYFNFETYAYIEQDAPTEDNWEIIVKIDDWNPTADGQKRKFTRCGLEIFQDSTHSAAISLLSNDLGTQIGYQCFWQTIPANPVNVWRYDGQLDCNNMGVSAERYIKLRRTHKGYSGFISVNGTDWLQCMSILQNPETPDGKFSNAKIRLFNAGGFDRPGETPGATPVKFDYIHLNPVTPYAGYLNDEFNGTALGPQWESHQGIGPGTIGFNEGSLMLTAGAFADVWEDKDQALYVYQDAPAMPHFASTVKVAPTQLYIPGPEFYYELFNCYGIWLWHDQCNWAFISNQRGDKNVGGTFVPNSRIEAAVKHNGLFDTTTIDFDSGNCPEYLRIEKNSGNCKLRYSFDNTNWSDVTFGAAGSVFPIGSENLQLRLFCKRASNSSDAIIDAAFDWLHSEAISPPAEINDWQVY